MKMTNKLESEMPKGDDKHSKMLNPMDPRVSKHYDMLGQPNATVPMDRELIEDIEYANQVRAF